MLEWVMDVPLQSDTLQFFKFKQNMLRWKRSEKV